MVEIRRVTRGIPTALGAGGLEFKSPRPDQPSPSIWNTAAWHKALSTLHQRVGQPDLAKGSPLIDGDIRVLVGRN